MLTVSDNLANIKLGAGEPFLLQIQIQTSTGAVADISARAFVLSFYKSDRSIVQQLAGEADSDDSGTFLRFEEDGTFSEGLPSSGIKIELAERYRNGRSVIATGSLSIDSTAASVPSLANGVIGAFATRVVIKDSTTLGGSPTFSQHNIAYVAPAAAVPAPTVGVLAFNDPLNSGHI